MKIEIESLDELLQLSELVLFGKAPREVRIDNKVETRVHSATGVAKLISDEVVRMAGNAAVAQTSDSAEPEGMPGDIVQPCSVGYTMSDRTFEEVQKDAAAAHEALVAVQLDADGVPHSTDWHSDPPKINADGRWKARRGRDNDAYKWWLQEQAVQVAEAAVAADAEPVATETHALPQDEQSEGAFRAAASRETASAETNEMTDKLIAEVRAALDVDLAALVEASQEAALDASDSHMDLIKACQVFISDHGHPAYNALKAAVAPLEGAENGKAVPQFTPAERRLMRACIENYPSN